MHKPIPNYSKAPRGLLVLVGVGRVYTAIANSPGESSRQLLARYAFRARRNLPDKELRSFLLILGSLNLDPAYRYADRTISCTFMSTECTSAYGL